MIENVRILENAVEFRSKCKTEYVTIHQAKVKARPPLVFLLPLLLLHPSTFPPSPPSVSDNVKLLSSRSVLLLCSFFLVS